MYIVLKKKIILRNNLKLNNMKTTVIITATRLQEMIENLFETEKQKDVVIIHAKKERIIKFIERCWGCYGDIIFL